MLLHRLLILLTHADSPLFLILRHMVHLLLLADDFWADPLLDHLLLLGATTDLIFITARFVLNGERCLFVALNVVACGIGSSFGWERGQRVKGGLVLLLQYQLILLLCRLLTAQCT